MKRREYLIALAICALFASAIDCMAFQKVKNEKQETPDSAQTAKIISILPFKGINLLSEELLSDPLVNGEAPARQSLGIAATPNSNNEPPFFEMLFARGVSVVKKEMAVVLPEKRASIKLLGVSACLSSISTVLLLMFSLRRKNNAPAVIAGLNKHDTTLLSDGEEFQEELEDRRVRESIGAIIKDEAASIAQHFHRNRGEFHLAMKFQQHKDVNHMVKKLEQIKQQSAMDTLVVAKQAGLGKGEVELALHLNEIEQSTNQPWGVR